MRVKLTFVFFLYFVFAFCQTKSKEKITHKTVIEFTEVLSGTISKLYKKPLEITDSVIFISEIRTLTKEQLQLFTDTWNKAAYKGPCKDKSEYFIDIYLKDGSIRNFRINGSIKEKKDYCYEPENGKLFKELWKNATPK